MLFTMVRLPVFILLLSFMIGCSLSADRYHPQYATYIQSIRGVLLLTPQIAIIQDNPQGKAVWNEQASQEAVRLAEQAVRRVLISKHLTVYTADRDLNTQTQVQNIQSLYSAVNRSIQLHTFGPQIFPDKIESFDYGLGSVADLLGSYNADALVLVRGFQTLSSVQPRDWISIGVVEPAGSIIWYHMERDKENLMQTETGMQALVESTLRHFMEGIR